MESEAGKRKAPEAASPPWGTVAVDHKSEHSGINAH